MLTVMFVLIAAAFVCAILSAIGKCPIWVPVILLCIVALFQVMPLK